METLRTRFAPTPSGFLHRGNAFSFILTWLQTRSAGGKIHLRIDDLDKTRRRKAYVQDIFDTLDWLQLDWDSGPRNPTEFYTHHSQQLRLKDYEQAAEKLREQGHLFACTCSRKEIRKHSEDGRYPGTCRLKKLPFDAPRTAWRMRTEAEQIVRFSDQDGEAVRVRLHAHLPDFVVRQKNAVVAYMLASLVDDVAQDINFIVRGQDLFYASAAQSLLAACLPAFQSFQAVRFLHHPLLLNPDGSKLSKSAGADALRTLRARGESPAMLFQQVAEHLRLPACRSAAELLDAFAGHKE